MAKYKDWLTDEGLLKIKQWARLGLTDEQIAKNIGISNRTLTRWKELEIDGKCLIRQALKKGREHAIEILENTMFKKANGFYEGDRYIPPDTASLIFLLKNWAKEQYRDKPMNELEMEKLRLENEQLALRNEIIRRELEGDDGLDRLEELVEGITNEALSDAETILDE